MGVSRLDSFQLLTNFASANTTGTPSATEAPLVSYPLNGQVSAFFSGTFGGGTASLEVTADGGVTWVPVVTAPVSLVAPGVLTWQGLALGVRAKVAGATAPLLNCRAVFADYC